MNNNAGSDEISSNYVEKYFSKVINLVKHASELPHTKVFSQKNGNSKNNPDIQSQRDNVVENYTPISVLPYFSKNTGTDNLQSPMQILSTKQYLAFQAVWFSTRSFHRALM